MRYYLITQGTYRGLIISENIYEEAVRLNNNYITVNSKSIPKIAIQYYGILFTKENSNCIISCQASDGQLRSKKAQDDYIIAAKISAIDPTNEEMYSDNTARLYVLLRSGETLSISTEYPFYNVALSSMDIFNGKLRFKTDYKNYAVSSQNIRNLINK